MFIVVFVLSAYIWEVFICRTYPDAWNWVIRVCNSFPIIGLTLLCMVVELFPKSQFGCAEMFFERHRLLSRPFPDFSSRARASCASFATVVAVQGWNHEDIIGSDRPRLASMCRLLKSNGTGGSIKHHPRSAYEHTHVAEEVTTNPHAPPLLIAVMITEP
jgi:hypothetical protein